VARGNPQFCDRWRATWPVGSREAGCRRLVVADDDDEKLARPVYNSIHDLAFEKADWRGWDAPCEFESGELRTVSPGDVRAIARACAAEDRR